MIYRSKTSDKNWSRLLQEKCPICAAPIFKKSSGYSCTLNDPKYPLMCPFFIREDVYDKLKKKLREEARTRVSKGSANWA